MKRVNDSSHIPLCQETSLAQFCTWHLDRKDFIWLESRGSDIKTVNAIFDSWQESGTIIPETYYLQLWHFRADLCRLPSLAAPSTDDSLLSELFPQRWDLVLMQCNAVMSVRPKVSLWPFLSLHPGLFGWTCSFEICKAVWVRHFCQTLTLFSGSFQFPRPWRKSFIAS